MKNKRAKIQNHIIEFAVSMGFSTDRYDKLFSRMSDTQFDKLMKSFKDDPTKQLYFEMNEEPSLDMIKRTAEKFKIPLKEHVKFRHLGKPIVTKEPIVVGYAHMRRHQQIISIKNKAPTKISQRNAITGMVTGKSRAGRMSDLDTVNYITYGAKNLLKEAFHPRSDNLVAKNQMYMEISTFGSTSLSSLRPDIKLSNSTAMNALMELFLSAGMWTDLLSDSLVLDWTQRQAKREELGKQT